MPAFGAFTGGLEVTDPAIADLFPGAFLAWVLGRDQVHPIPAKKVRGRETGGWTLR
jgi:hypothetical protein